MTSLFSRLDRTARRLPDAVLMAIAVAILFLLAAIKVSTAWHDVPIVDFFLVPVASMAWLARSRAWGYVTALLAAAITIVVARLGAPDAPLAAALVSAGFRLVYYLVVVALIEEAHKLVLAHAEEARVDPLTGVANTRAFREEATREIERSRRYPRPLSLLYLDVDDFKTVNDSSGHEVGDRLLASIGHAMACSVRSTDLVARVGGDEFVALMPETDRLAAGQVARRARAELARVRMPDGRSARCSIGVVTLSSPPASVDELIHHADDLMYRAKQRGKDGIESAQVASTPS
ncbi:MAG TPA: GGDEF domain-containing protein [Thermoleophilia bacterium]|nr:GGDEF domain-containing protein [Thermoleophilia bacterium]